MEKFKDNINNINKDENINKALIDEIDSDMSMNDNYGLIYKDLDNIIEEMKFDSIEDRELCRAIINSAEREMAALLKQEKCIQIPTIVTIRKNPIYKVGVEHYKDFKEKRQILSKEEYKDYVADVINKGKEDIRNKEIIEKRIKNLKKFKLKKYLDYKKKFGDVYANAWLFSILHFDVVDFDPDVEQFLQDIRNE